MSDKIENNNWVDDMVDQVTEQICSIAKFKTHKQRKTFLGNISSLIKESINKNVTPEDKKRVKPLVITNPNLKESQGFAIMTEGKSALGDEIGKNSRSIKAGMRHW